MQISKLLSRNKKSKGVAIAAFIAGSTALSQNQVEAAIALLLTAIGFIQMSLGPKADWVESFRQKYWLKLHELLSFMGGYSVLETSNEEYVATVKVGEEKLEEILYRNNFHRNVVAAKKYRTSHSGVKQYSAGSWVHRESLLSRMQTHLTLFPGDTEEETRLYVHYEYSWVTHPVKHYNGEGYEYGDPEGVVKGMLEKEDVELTDGNRFSDL